MLGVAEEGRINTSIAQAQGLAIDLNRSVLQRSNEIVGRVHQREQVAAVRPALAIGNSDESFDRLVARARPHASKARVESHRTRFGGTARVGHSKRKALMSLDDAIGYWLGPARSSWRAAQD